MACINLPLQSTRWDSVLSTVKHVGFARRLMSWDSTLRVVKGVYNTPSYPGLVQLHQHIPTHPTIIILNSGPITRGWSDESSDEGRIW